MTLYDAKCPNCQQIVTINHAQLASKNGYVRCTHCQTFFLASPSLPAADVSTPAQSQHNAPTESLSLDDNLDDIRFDDELGLDEAGNPIITQPNAISRYAISQPYLLSANSKPNPVSDEVEILENFDHLSQSQEAKPKRWSVQQKIEATEDTAWLESLMATASGEEQADLNTASDSKRYGKLPMNADILDQIAIDSTNDNDADLLSYQQKIDQRLAQQVSSQTAVSATFSGMGFVWGIGSLLLLLALVAQWLIFNIDTLVTSKPTAAKLTSACQRLAITCNLPMADTDLIDVETLKLATAPNQSEQTDIIFTLTNTTDHPIVYPNLKISLRTGNTIQAQTLIPPMAYLEAGNNYLMPHQIKPIKLRINYPKSNTLQANIESFY